MIQAVFDNLYVAMACGSDVGLESYPYAYFVNPDKSYLNKIVCVSECPK